MTTKKKEKPSTQGSSTFMTERSVDDALKNVAFTVLRVANAVDADGEGYNTYEETYDAIVAIDLARRTCRRQGVK